MINKHHNPFYSGSIPLSVGDRYYSQDLHRDFYYFLDRLGLTMGDLTDQNNFIISGGAVSQVSSADQVDITPFVGYVKIFAILPDDFGAAIPPATVSQDVEFVRIESPAIAAFTAPNVNAITYYVKMTFSEDNLNTRARAKKAGSYAYEMTPSYTLTIDSTPPTAYQILLTIYVGSGPTNAMKFRTEDGSGNSISTGPSFAHEKKRNYIINGNFDFWQRGTTVTLVAATGYMADRWEATSGAGNTVIYNRQAFTLGQTEIPHEPKHFAQLQRTVNGNTDDEFIQKIENVRSLAGKKVYVSFYVKVSGGAPIDIDVDLIQNFGTGGGESGTITTNAITAQTLQSEWQKISFTLAIPSIFGKTLGSNDDDFLGLQITTNPNATYTLQIAQIQLNESPLEKPVPWESRSLEEELSLCQRYYYQQGDGTSNVQMDGSTLTADTSLDLYTILPVAIRAIPTVVMSGTWNGFDSGGIRSITTGTAGSALLRSNYVISGWVIATGLGTRTHIYCIGSSAKLTIDAEL